MIYLLISNELSQGGRSIISCVVQRSPNEAEIKFKHTQKDLEEHYNKSITALTNVGGPVKDAALMIQSGLKVINN